jgi:hypothetical protein
MTAATYDACPCGTPIPSEAAAQRHAAVCTRQGEPGCHVTMWNQDVIRGGRRGTKYPRCGKPVVKLGLCAKHLADKERLS